MPAGFCTGHRWEAHHSCQKDMDESQQQRYRIEHSGQRPDDRSRQERSRSIEANPVNPRYSYMDGPNESDIPTLTSVSANTRSQISRPENLPAILQEPPHSPYPVEKPSADRAVSPYNFPPPLETHPAHFAPYADSTVRDTVHSALNPPQAPHSASPIPSKVQMGSPGVESTTADNTDEAHAFRASQTGQTGRESQWSLPQPTHAPVYNPESLSGPNGVTPANHQPGQSVHPNMELNDGQWRHGLCGCETSICALGICCPCVLYGKTEYRLSQRAAKKDPTDLLGYKACNGGCTLMAVACGFQCQCII